MASWKLYCSSWCHVYLLIRRYRQLWYCSYCEPNTLIRTRNNTLPLRLSLLQIHSKNCSTIALQHIYLRCQLTLLLVSKSIMVSVMQIAMLIMMKNPISLIVMVILLMKVNQAVVIVVMMMMNNNNNSNQIMIMMSRMMNKMVKTRAFTVQVVIVIMMMNKRSKMMIILVCSIRINESK